MAVTSGNALTLVPGIAPAGLADWQVDIRGVRMGAGTDYLIHQWEGFGSPEVRNTDQAREQDDGDWAGVDTYSSRTMTITLTVRGDTAADAKSKYDSLLSAWRVNRDYVYTELWWKFPGQDPTRVVGRPRRISGNLSQMLVGKITVVAEFYSPLPHVFGANVSDTATQLAITGGGRSYSPTFTYPRYYDVSTSGGPVTIVNPGAPTYPILTFHGYDPAPKLLQGTTNEYIKFDLPLAAGDSLVVDMRLRTAKKNGANARRYLSAGSTWWNIPPGTTSLWYSGPASVDVLYAPAWVG